MSAPLPTASRWNTYSRSRYPGLWDGCVGAWCPSLGVTGSRLFDFSGRQNWGTLTNMDPATDWVVSSGGYALDFDGSNDHAPINLPVTSYPFALSCWMRPASLHTAPLVSVFNVTTELRYSAIYLINDGSVRAQTSDGSAAFAASAASAYAAGVLVHIMAVFVSSALREIYLGGTLRGSDTASSGFPAVDSARIGGIRFRNEGVVNEGYFSGMLDDIRIYNRAPHREEIRLLARRRAIAYEPEYQPAYYMEPAAGGVTSRPYAYQSARMIGAGR
jgi:hypothetical protein